MAGFPKAMIASRIEAALLASGATSSGSFAGVGGDLPWKSQVVFEDGARRDYAIYFWTISHGGRTRRQSEYRIQAMLKTGRELRFDLGTTLLMGYYNGSADKVGREEGNVASPEMEVFAAWDPLLHLRVGASSSCQVPFALLADSYTRGASSIVRRTGDGSPEQVVAFRPDILARYLRAAAGGHNGIAIRSLVDG